MIDLSGIVAGMADTDLAVTRHTTGWATTGLPTDTTSALSVRALVVPGRRQGRPELQGDVTVGSVDVYSVTRLRDGDTFTWQGASYRVTASDSYEATGNFAVTRALRVP